MVDTVITTMGNDNDDWEVAVDTGEFDKRLEEQEQDRAAKQESIPTSLSSTVNNDENENSSNNNLMKLNKPIRILKRPTSQSQFPVTNDINNSNTTTIVSNNATNNDSPFYNNTSSSTTVPTISIIPRNQTKDSLNTSQTINLTSSSSSQSNKPPIKTYEQREQEYRLARLRIMGEEESSAKDDEDDNNNNPIIESVVATSDEKTKTTSLPTTTLSATKTSKKTTSSSHTTSQSHSTPSSYASNLYALSNGSSNTGPILFNPNSNTTGPFSQQRYRSTYSNVYPQMPLAPTVHYQNAAFHMPLTVSSSSNYLVQSSMNTWYPFQQQQQQQQQNPYGTQQYGYPQ
ncbi:unnamed protein product [Rotaria magnacalcarata]|uniref:SUZ domain-containing protein n=2 Tax=Rotaria magnacalcarata TaxID=392030 RepID=A0A819P5L6_9BILA|nr:unnamed protein product [Rotaria magnacalcarata]CAF4003028.1 unnamed protein product [Rotaria magnacalcarata]